MLRWFVRYLPFAYVAWLSKCHCERFNLIKGWHTVELFKGGELMSWRMDDDLRALHQDNRHDS